MGSNVLSIYHLNFEIVSSLEISAWDCSKKHAVYTLSFGRWLITQLPYFQRGH